MDNFNKLTTKEHWDESWQRVKSPAVIRESEANLLTLELLKVLNRFLPRQPGLSFLEIGGAPGQFLAYFSEKFGYIPYALDYSDTGFENLCENFNLLNLDFNLIQRDFFEDVIP